MKFQKDTLLNERYRILAKIGEGGFGTVYHAFDETLNRDVALKVLKAEAVFSEEDFQRFKRESRILARLSHQNIVGVFAIELFDNQSTVIVMEYLNGVTLKSMLSGSESIRSGSAGFGSGGSGTGESGGSGSAGSGSAESGSGGSGSGGSTSPGSMPGASKLPTSGLDFRTIDQIFRQTCAGIAHAHAEGIVHRDLSPANIYVENSQADLKVKIIDFGLSRLRSIGDLPKDKNATASVALTKTGLLVGNPAYMSPEACRGEPVDALSDIYSLGCVLYEMLHGKRMFDSVDAMGLLYKHQNEYPIAPTSAGEAQAQRKSLASVALLCLQKNKLKRPPSVNEIVDLLDNKEELDARLENADGWAKSSSKQVNLKSIVIYSVAAVALILVSSVIALTWFKAHSQSQENNGKIVQHDDIVLNRLLDRLRRKEGHFGNDHPALIPPLMELSRYYWEHRGVQYDRNFKQILERTLLLEERHPGNRNAQIDTLMQLTDFYGPTDCAKCEHFAHEGMRLVMERSGVRDELYCAFLEKLGISYENHGRFDDAEKLADETIRIRQMGGEKKNNWLLMQSETRLGSILQHAEHPKQALSAYKKAYEIAFGIIESYDATRTDNPHDLIYHSLSALLNLCSYYMQMNNCTAGLMECQKTLALMHKCDDVALRNNYSEILRGEAHYESALGKETAAEASFRAAIKAATDNYKTNNFGLVNALNDFGVYYREHDRAESAIELFTRAATLSEEIGPPDSQSAAQQNIDIAWCYVNMKRYAEAEAIYHKLIPRFERIYPPGSNRWQMASAFKGFACSREGQGDYSGAIELNEKAVQILAHFEHPDLSGMIETHLRNAELYTKLGNSGAAQIAYNHALESLKLEKSIGQINRENIQIADYWKRQKAFAKARELLFKVLSGMGSEDWDLPLKSDIYEKIGETYHLQDNEKDCVKSLQQAIKLHENCPSGTQFNVPMLYTKMAESFLRDHKFEEAKKAFSHAIELWHAAGVRDNLWQKVAIKGLARAENKANNDLVGH